MGGGSAGRERPGPWVAHLHLPPGPHYGAQPDWRDQRHERHLAAGAERLHSVGKISCLRHRRHAGASGLYEPGHGAFSQPGKVMGTGLSFFPPSAALPWLWLQLYEYDCDRSNYKPDSPITLAHDWGDDRF